MARETFNISFICRETKKNKLGYSPIIMTIIVNGERTQIQLPMKAKPEEFKAAMKGSGEKQIQEYCLEQRKRVDRVLTELLRDDIKLTSANLKAALQNSGAGKIYTLTDLFGEYLSLIEKRKGKTLSVDTYNRYVKTTKMFMDYNDINGDFAASKISLSHFLNYQAELNKRLDVSTSCNYLQKIKSIFKFAFETGKIPSNPSYGLKIDKGVKDTILYLTQDEVKKIEGHEFATRRLQEVADVFLFACYTGLAWGDMETISKGDFQKNTYGYLFIEKARIKTGIKFCAILLPEAQRIAEKYNYNFPIKSGQKTNEYLKEIGQICEISKSLHFHMARHTAAAFLLNYRPAIPNETIMRIMGWKNEKQLRHYARLFNSTVFEDISKAFGAPKPLPRPETEKERQKDEDDIEAFKHILGID